MLGYSHEYIYDYARVSVVMVSFYILFARKLPMAGHVNRQKLNVDPIISLRKLLYENDRMNY